MSNSRRTLAWVALPVLLLALAACDESSNPLTAVPQFAIVGAEPCADDAPESKYFKLIKEGGSGTFSVVVHDADHVEIEETEVSLDAGECALVHFNSGDWADRTYVTVTETSADPISLECVAIDDNEGLRECLNAYGNSARHRVTDCMGAVATFTNGPDMAFGRMTGGGVVRMREVGGELVKITHGFTLHCDITLSNNLEINWGGNQWHLEKESLEDVSCTDEPGVDPEPPPAPFDTFYARAIGRYNGDPGYEIEFTLQDAGEPGGSNDKAGMTITDPDGNEVLFVPFAFTEHGNLQAHYDQPHGSNVNR
jgi:hypothetical protein